MEKLHTALDDYQNVQNIWPIPVELTHKFEEVLKIYLYFLNTKTLICTNHPTIIKIYPDTKHM